MEEQGEDEVEQDIRAVDESSEDNDMGDEYDQSVISLNDPHSSCSDDDED